MPRAPTELLAPEAELIFGLVGAVGTDLGRFQQVLENQLQSYGYAARALRLSSLIGAATPVPPHANEADRIRNYMEAGTKLRRQAGRGEVVAMLAVADIASKRVFDKYKLEREGAIRLGRAGTHPQSC